MSNQSKINQQQNTQGKLERKTLEGSFLPMDKNAPPVEVIISKDYIPYEEALDFMEKRIQAIHKDEADELIWFLEHPPVITAGTSANEADLIDGAKFPVFQTGRGGQYTYHGPGQRVVYVMLDLKRRQQDVRQFVAALENWVIATLAEFNIKGEQREDRVGVWVRRPEKPRLLNGDICEDKIAAIGIRLRKWISFHGISINHEPELSHYQTIIPCGISDYGVTSLVDLGVPLTMEDLDLALIKTFKQGFGRIKN